MGADRAERAEEDVEADPDAPPTSSPDEQVVEMFARLDDLLDGEQESFEALDRTSMELRRSLRGRRVDSKSKLRAALTSIPPPAPLPLEE